MKNFLGGGSRPTRGRKKTYHGFKEKRWATNAEEKDGGMLAEVKKGVRKKKANLGG